MLTFLTDNIILKADVLTLTLYHSDTFS